MRKFWKIIKWFVGVCTAIFVLDLGVILGFAVSHPKVENADAIVILGAAINSPALYNRSLEGLKLYNEGKAPLLVLSGGRISDKDITEATYMERVIQKNAQKPLDLILEENSHSTFDNMENTKAKIPKANSIIIVTDKYHIARSFFMAKAAGFAKVSWSAPEDYPERQVDLVYHYLREATAMLAYLPKFVLK